MKKKFTLIAPVLLLGATHAMAEDYLTPYAGIDAQVRHMNFKKGYGDNLFAHNTPQANLYAGLKFNEFVGIEIGVEGNSKKNKTKIVRAGDTFLGQPILLGISQTTYHATDKTTSFHANLIGFYPITCDNQVYASVGAARIKSHFTTRAITVLDDQGQSVFDSPLRTENFKKNKTVLRLGVGMQQMLTSNAGVRAGVTWENTSKLRDIKASGRTTPERIKLEDNFSYNLGLFWKF